jgi:predicted dehydrogenase
MFNACIVGAGSIGALKPDEFDSPKTENILTHAHALYHFKEMGRINEFFIVDKDYKKKQEAKEKWHCKTFSNLKSLKIQTTNIDIFVIAVPTEYHKDVIDEILENFNPKMIIVEKPFCYNYREALQVYQKCMKREIVLVVNYTRRFCLSIQSLKNEFDCLKYGKIKACNILYVRGFIRDACHAIDLCNYFFGEFRQGNILGNRMNSYEDYSKDDLTLPVWMEFENCPNVYFTPIDGNDMSIFEFDILTEQARIQLVDHFRQTKIYEKNDSCIYGNFSSLSYENVSVFDNNLETSLYYLYFNSFAYLKGQNKQLISSGRDALKVQEIYRRLGIEKEKHSCVKEIDKVTDHFGLFIRNGFRKFRSLE